MSAQRSQWMGLEVSRRRFLGFLAASPLLAKCNWDVIATADQALSVLDFEEVARRRMYPAHFGYIESGVDDGATVLANRDAFTRFEIRPRRLRVLSTYDASIQLFGRAWETPIFLSPASAQKMCHEDGELATARAARAQRHLQILAAAGSSYSLDQVNQARGEPVWCQVYPTDQWSVTQQLVQHVEAAGCPALVLTVDSRAPRNLEGMARAKRHDVRHCNLCHEFAKDGPVSLLKDTLRRPLFNGIDTAGVTAIAPRDLDWNFVDRLRHITKMRLVLKGIMRGDDAAIALQHGVDAIIVSNHGGRIDETGRATLDALVEVVAAVKGRMPVLIDGGFRRGTDVFKALALGATAVGIGRPGLWGLAAFGQKGVETVLHLLRKELKTAMTLAGVASIKDIDQSYVVEKASCSKT